MLKGLWSKAVRALGFGEEQRVSAPGALPTLISNHDGEPLVVEIPTPLALSAPPVRRGAPMPTTTLGSDVELIKREIERAITNGAKTYNKIARHLNNAEVRTVRGFQWGVNNLKLFIEDHGIQFQTTGRQFRKTPALRPSKKSPEKQKRIRRTQAEIAAGLSHEQVVALRGGAKKAVAPVATPKAKQGALPVRRPLGGEREDVTDRVLDRQDHPDFDADKMMRPHIVARRDDLVAFKRSRGLTRPLTPEEMDQIKFRVDSGAVTRLPAGVDSEGNNHFEIGGSEGFRFSGTPMLSNPTGRQVSLRRSA